MARATKRLPFATRMFLRTKSSVEIDGLWIGALFDKGLDRVVEAVKLIRDHDPLQYRRILRDLDRVIITLLASGFAGQYQTRLNACELDERWVMHETVPVELLASAIVHEATHARLERLGFAYHEARRRRIEQVCTRRELAFVAHLPNGQAVHQSIEERMQHPFDLSENGFVLRSTSAEQEAIRYLGVPRWLVRTLFAIAATINAARRLRYRILGWHSPKHHH